MAYSCGYPSKLNELFSASRDHRHQIVQEILGQSCPDLGPVTGSCLSSQQNLCAFRSVFLCVRKQNILTSFITTTSPTLYSEFRPPTAFVTCERLAWFSVTVNSIPMSVSTPKRLKTRIGNVVTWRSLPSYKLLKLKLLRAQWTRIYSLCSPTH
jgi:hypothetical protein